MSDRAILSDEDVMETLARLDARAAKMHQHDEVTADNALGAAGVETATVAAEIGISKECLDMLTQNATVRTAQIVAAGGELNEGIDSTFVHALLLGQEMQLARMEKAEPTYTRDQLLRCLTGSGADAFAWLAELIGADDDEIDQAKED